jgi:DNA-directed RNA polymerase specialized sigma24 family protein
MIPQAWLDLARTVAWRTGRNPEMAPDLQQEGLMAVMNMAADSPLAFVGQKMKWAMIDFLRNNSLLSRGEYAKLKGTDLPRYVSLEGVPESIDPVLPEDYVSVRQKIESLTPLELEVTQALVSGYSMTEIAERRGVTLPAICHATKRVKRKLS